MFSGINRFSNERFKKESQGFSERTKALKKVCPAADKIADSALSKYRWKEVAKDDILDALVEQ